MSAGRWPRLAVTAAIRGYQMTVSHLVFQCRFTPSWAGSHEPRSLAPARRDGRDTWIPDDRLASGVPVSLHAVVLALHAGGGRAVRRAEGELARHQAHPPLPPAAPRRVRPRALGVPWSDASFWQ